MDAAPALSLSASRQPPNQDPPAPPGLFGGGYTPDDIRVGMWVRYRHVTLVRGRLIREVCTGSVEKIDRIGLLRVVNTVGEAHTIEATRIVAIIDPPTAPRWWE